MHFVFNIFVMVTLLLSSIEYKWLILLPQMVVKMLIQTCPFISRGVGAGVTSFIEEQFRDVPLE